MRSIAFFNNKGGVGKTTLIYHLAHMLSSRGIHTLAVDLDPQSNLSAMFLPEERIDTIWKRNQSITASLQPITAGTGDISPAHIEPITRRLSLIASDLSLSSSEDHLAEAWSKCLGGEERAFRVISSLHRIIQDAATTVSAQMILIDLGPNLGSLNRAALLSSDHLVLPVAPDLFSLQGLKNLGPTLKKWRKDWKKREDEVPDIDPPILLPRGDMAPIGYVVMSFGVRDSRPVKAYDVWLDKIPSTYRTSVLDQAPASTLPTTSSDPFCLASLKHYRSLMPMAMESRKPMFSLQTSDGAIGSHQEAVRKCYSDFLHLARRIADQVGVSVP